MKKWPPDTAASEGKTRSEIIREWLAERAGEEVMDDDKKIDLTGIPVTIIFDHSRRAGRAQNVRMVGRTVTCDITLTEAGREWVLKELAKRQERLKG